MQRRDLSVQGGGLLAGGVQLVAAAVEPAGGTGALLLWRQPEGAYACGVALALRAKTPFTKTHTQKKQ